MQIRYSTSRLLRSLATTLLCCALSAAAMADPVRISVAQFSQDPAKVAALEKGLAEMRALSTTDQMAAPFRTSLAYWANTHGYVGTGTHATSMQTYIIGKRMPQCLATYSKETCNLYYKHIVNIDVPDDGFTDSIWGTCQHSTATQQNLFFLPWHRFYLHFYERTLRKHSGDPSFALPYWKYYDNYSAKKKGISLPSIVTGTKTAAFDTWRTPLLNQGIVPIDPDSASAAQAFGMDKFDNFSKVLEQQPHGAMHCAVGSNCYMPDIGFVPIAGIDPLFYMHHANIDRLWQCWLNTKAKGQTIDLAWAKANLGMPDSWFEQKFTFVDENGKPVTVQVSDVFNPEYSPQYNDLNDCGAGPTRLKSGQKSLTAAAVAPMKAQAPLAAGKPITLSNSSVSVKLQAAPQALLSEKSATAVNQPVQTYLILENVELTGAPSLTYKVYLVSNTKPAKSSYVATFSYFAVGPVHEGHGGNSLGTLTYKIDTNLAELGVTSTGDVSVRFLPTNLLVGQKLPVQKAGNGVTVANIRIETSAEEPAQ